MDIFKLFNKKFITILLIVFIFLGILIYVLNYINSQQFITVNYKNISRVTIQRFGKSTRESQDIIIIPKSSEKMKVSKDSYSLKYIGNSGYDSDYKNITIGNKPVSIRLDPSYSEDRLSYMLEDEFKNIEAVLNEKYQNMSDYDIQIGKLYKKGEWYATTLQYIGNDYYNYDTLRLVMKKENNKWRLITDPPSIIISSYKYPDIPIDVLRDVNNNQNTMFTEEYTDPTGKVYFP
jgi:hypothetical protein